MFGTAEKMAEPHDAKSTTASSSRRGKRRNNKAGAKRPAAEVNLSVEGDDVTSSEDGGPSYQVLAMKSKAPKPSFEADKEDCPPLAVEDPELKNLVRSAKPVAVDLVTSTVRRMRDFEREIIDCLSEIGYRAYADCEQWSNQPPHVSTSKRRMLDFVVTAVDLMQKFTQHVENLPTTLYGIPIPPSERIFGTHHPLHGVTLRRIFNAYDRLAVQRGRPMPAVLGVEDYDAILKDLEQRNLEREKSLVVKRPVASVMGETAQAVFPPVCCSGAGLASATATVTASVVASEPNPVLQVGSVSCQVPRYVTSALQTGAKGGVFPVSTGSAFQAVSKPVHNSNEVLLEERENMKRMSYAAYHTQVFKVICREGFFGKDYLEGFTYQQWSGLCTKISSAKGNEYLARLETFVKIAYDKYNVFFKPFPAVDAYDVMVTFAERLTGHFVNVKYRFSKVFGVLPILE